MTINVYKARANISTSRINHLVNIEEEGQTKTLPWSITSDQLIINGSLDGDDWGDSTDDAQQR